MPLREVYDHPSLDKQDLDKNSGASEKSSYHENSGGGEIGKTIEVRDSTDRSMHENVNSNDRSTPETKEKNPEVVSPGREPSDRNPIPKKDNTNPYERENHNNSEAGRLAQKMRYILSNGYVNDRDELNNIIRCGNLTCSTFGPPKQKKEINDLYHEIFEKFKKLAEKLVKGKKLNPYVEAGRELIKTTNTGNDESDMTKISQELDMFIFKNEHPDILKKYNEFHIEKFPDLKSPEELNKPQFKQQRDYIDYNIY